MINLQKTGKLTILYYAWNTVAQMVKKIISGKEHWFDPGLESSQRANLPLRIHAGKFHMDREEASSELQISGCLKSDVVSN